MYYKVIYNKRTVDILDSLKYCKFQLKHKILLLCDKEEAQGILSSDGTSAYHTVECLAFPVDTYPTVTIEEITKAEYDSLARLHLKTPEEIVEEVLLDLMNRGAV